MRRDIASRILTMCLAASMLSGTAGCTKDTILTEANKTTQEKPTAGTTESTPDISPEEQQKSVRFGTDNTGYFIVQNCNRNLYEYQDDGWTANMSGDNITRGLSSDTEWSNACYKVNIEGDTAIDSVIVVNAGNSSYVDKLLENSGITDWKDVLTTIRYNSQVGGSIEPEDFTETEVSGWKGMETIRKNGKEAVFMKDFNGTYLFLDISGDGDTFDTEVAEILDSFTPSGREQTAGLFGTSGFGENELDFHRQFSDGRFGILDVEKNSAALYRVNLAEAGADMDDDKITWASYGLQKIDGTFGGSRFAYGVYNKNICYGQFTQNKDGWEKDVRKFDTKDGKITVEIYRSDAVTEFIAVYENSPFIVQAVAEAGESEKTALVFLKKIRLEKVQDCQY